MGAQDPSTDEAWSEDGSLGRRERSRRKRWGKAYSGVSTILEEYSVWLLYTILLCPYHGMALVNRRSPRALPSVPMKSRSEDCLTDVGGRQGFSTESFEQDQYVYSSHKMGPCELTSENPRRISRQEEFRSG